MPLSATNQDKRPKNNNIKIKKYPKGPNRPLFKCFTLCPLWHSNVLLDLYQCNPFPPVALCYIMADQPADWPAEWPSGSSCPPVGGHFPATRHTDLSLAGWQRRALCQPNPTTPLPRLVFRIQASGVCCMLTRNQHGLTSRSHTNLCRWCLSSASPVRPSLSPRSGTQSGIH